MDSEQSHYLLDGASNYLFYIHCRECCGVWVELDDEPNCVCPSNDEWTVTTVPFNLLVQNMLPNWFVIV